jgi:putative Mg2+ transporter-C (MgtC) family protein
MESDLFSLIFNGFNTQLLIAALLGGLIGVERELAGKDPSIRTFALISLGSCIFTLLSWESVQAFHSGDPGRIAAQIVPGIGFIGAGTIFRGKTGVSGFTTAALMWVTASIGMAVGFHREDLAISATLIAIIITLSLRFVHGYIRKRRPDLHQPSPHDT